MIRLSHPLNSTLNTVALLPKTETSNLGSIIDIFLIHFDLFKQCDHFHLPSFLEFAYNSSNFDPQINTEIGFRIRNDPNILDSFNLFLSSLKQDASFYTDGSKMISDSLILRMEWDASFIHLD